MGYIDRKTRVIDFVLTEKGRLAFSQGTLKIMYYAFSDDGVDYRPTVNGTRLSGSSSIAVLKNKTMTQEPSYGEGETQIKYFIFDNDSEIRPRLTTSWDSVTIAQKVKRIRIADLYRAINRGASETITFIGIERIDISTEESSNDESGGGGSEESFMNTLT